MLFSYLCCKKVNNFRILDELHHISILEAPNQNWAELQGNTVEQDCCAIIRNWKQFRKIFFTNHQQSKATQNTHIKRSWSH